LHKICSDRADYKYDLYSSQSCIHGRTQEIQYLINEVSDLEDTDWDGLDSWIKVARSDEEAAAKLYPRIVNMVDIWKKHRAESNKTLGSWLKEMCAIITTYTKSEPVVILQTGGGLLESENKKIFEEILDTNGFSRRTENSFTNPG
jgi:hypothetical protein